MARDTAQAAVALGGGHGLAASLSALRRLKDDLTIDELTAVVTVADNGGSSGRLRGEFGVLPPGDLRMALAALCGDDEWGRTWADVVQHRFAGQGEMQGHVVGNLLIVSLWELMGDHVRALDWVGRLLGAHGRVLPMATTPMDITARVRGADPADPTGRQRRTRPGRGRDHVGPDRVGRASCPRTRRRARRRSRRSAAAEWVVLGPGSWFTSVIPHLWSRAAACAGGDRGPAWSWCSTSRPRWGRPPASGPPTTSRALFEHAPDLTVHAVLVDACSLADDRELLERAVGARGARLVVETSPCRASRGTTRPPGRRLRPDRRRGVRPTRPARRRGDADVGC